MVIDPDDDNVFVSNDEPRYPIKANNDSSYGFEKDVGVVEAAESTSAETESDMYDQYIGGKLQIPDKDEMKRTERFRQILCNVYGNPEGTGNYRARSDHTENEIGFFDGSTSKLTMNIISENMLSQVDS